MTRVSASTNSSVINFGCRINSYESEIIKQHVKSAGVENSIVINSCSVTSEAERELRQTIRKLKKEDPTRKIILTGCAAQSNSKFYEGMEEVDYIVGNSNKTNEETYQEIARGEAQRFAVDDIMEDKNISLNEVKKYEDKSRAFLQIQTGCNHRCTFCIIPFGRGNSRSVPLGQIVDIIKKAVANGYNEVVLSGVDITSYGEDLPGQIPLGNAIRRILKLVPELPRLRLSSIDVAEIDPDLIDVVQNEPRFMPYFHISLQSGDNLILKRMKRRHNRQQVIDFCNQIRALRPDAAFGADIIAGFPTETEEMFMNSYNLVKEANLQYLHVFTYSERSGTPAARMPQLPKAIRKDRTKRLIELGKEQITTFLTQYIGTVQKVVLEKHNNAHAENFMPIWVENSENVPLEQGSILEVTCLGLNDKKDRIIAKLQ